MKHRTRLLILSPHPDDVAFSCADHVKKWQTRNVDVTVCTVFTKFKTPKLSRDAKKYLTDSQCPNPLFFEKIRKKEDKDALSFLKTSSIDANLTDGLFRTYHHQAIYNSFGKLFSGKINKHDRFTFNKLSSYLKRAEKKYDFIIAPIGIGNHIDHLLTNICAKQVISPNKLLFYYDVPYYFNLKLWEIYHLKQFLLSKKTMIFTSQEKIKCLSLYPSQLPLIIHNHQNFFFNQKLQYYPEIIIYPNKKIIL
jgi:LmbE family N-acetylglucosaminyl deacetylase